MTWLVPVLGALYSLLVLNSDSFKEREGLKLQQKRDLSAWNLDELHHQTEITAGELPDADGD
jgi:hypothetical protein